MAHDRRLDGAARLAAALICSLPMTASAEDGPAPRGEQPSQATLCDLSAWIADDAPAGLALRAGPGTDFPAVAAVPPPYSDGAENYLPEASITGSSNGWFRISRIVTNLYGGAPGDPVTAFSGEGWLPGDVLGLWVEAGSLRSRPSSDAPLAYSFGQEADGETGGEAEGETGGPDAFAVERLLACDGLWVEVEGSYAGDRPRGWTGDVCANQVTTCP